MTFAKITHKFSNIAHNTLLSLLAALFSISPVFAEQRVALVIGNAVYSKSANTNNIFGPLDNPLNDVEDMTKRLQSYDFTVVSVKNATKQQMETAINNFIRQLRRGTVGLFYYSGHGVQVQNINYLIPVNQTFRDTSDVKYHAINAKWILDKMASAGAQVNIMILDACREPLPLARSKAFRKGGLAKMGAKGVFIGYATTPGMTASDGTGRNGLYTQHLLDAMKRGDLPIEQVFKKAGAGVAKATQNRQVPWISSALFGEFCFGTCGQRPQSAVVSRLLQQCQKHFDANRLTKGRGGTAFGCYKQVLKKEPTNAEALVGLKKIEARYVELIKRALDKRQQSKAKQYLAKLHLVNLELQKWAKKVPQPSSPSFPSVDTTQPQQSHSPQAQNPSIQAQSPSLQAQNPSPQVQNSSPQQVSRLLRECKKHFEAYRLVTGEGGTAFECYKEVLKKEPTNREALAGLKQIEVRYARWAKRALDREQLYEARAYLARLRTVNPASVALPPLEAQLNRLEEALAKLLRTCQAHLRANRLTTGKGGTALACYKEVLKKDKTNAEALAGLRTIDARLNRLKGGLAKLLRTCKAHLRANRLTTGKGGTALACYKEVLKKDKTNAEALAGLRTIEARYVKWAKRALDKRWRKTAKRYLDKLRLVNPESPSLAELETRLNRLKRR
jgi:uncharacterized caspase-like protein